MNCPACGKAIIDTRARFCPYCARPLDLGESAEMLARADIPPERDHALPRFRAEELEDGNVRNPLEPLLHKRLAYFRIFMVRSFRRKRIESPVRQAVDLEAVNRRNDKGLAVQERRQFGCPYHQREHAPPP